MITCDLFVERDQTSTEPIARLRIPPGGEVADRGLPGVRQLCNGLLRKPASGEVGQKSLEVHAPQYNVPTFTRKDVISPSHTALPPQRYKHVMDTVGERLRHARRTKKLTQKQLAKLAGTTQGAISDLEVGRNESSRDLPKYAAVLGVAALWLATGSGPMQDVSETAAPIKGVQPSKQITSALFIRCYQAAQLFCVKTGRHNVTTEDMLELACRLYEQHADHPERSTQELCAYLLNVSGMLRLL